MVKENGQFAAAFAGWFNEVFFGDLKGQLSGDRQMDDHNNAVGRNLAKCADDCDKGCRASLLAGTLTITGYGTGRTAPIFTALPGVNPRRAPYRSSELPRAQAI
jgi:hypothetical protein